MAPVLATGKRSADRGGTPQEGGAGQGSRHVCGRSCRRLGASTLSWRIGGTAGVCPDNGAHPSRHRMQPGRPPGRLERRALGRANRPSTRVTPLNTSRAVCKTSKPSSPRPRYCAGIGLDPFFRWKLGWSWQFPRARRRVDPRLPSRRMARRRRSAASRRTTPWQKRRTDRLGNLRHRRHPARGRESLVPAGSGTISNAAWCVRSNSCRPAGSTARFRAAGRNPMRSWRNTNPGSEGRFLPVEGHCSCPVGYNCKHAAAVLLAARHLSPDGDDSGSGAAREGVSGVVRRWLDRWPEAAAGKEDDRPGGPNAAAGPPALGREHLFYVIHSDETRHVHIAPYRAYLRKDGTIGTNFREYRERTPSRTHKYLSAEGRRDPGMDRVLCRRRLSAAPRLAGRRGADRADPRDRRDRARASRRYPGRRALLGGSAAVRTRLVGRRVRRAADRGARRRGIAPDAAGVSDAVLHRSGKAARWASRKRR